MIPGKLEAAVNDIRRLPNIVHVNMCDIRYLSGVFPPQIYGTPALMLIYALM